MMDVPIPCPNPSASPARPGPHGQKDRVVRLFVSSTFRDMVEDRNELMSHVWPALRKLCRSRSVEFAEVDLRWGITEAQSQRKETLRRCLTEIRRCRPYFVCLLGERYGTIPGRESFPATLLAEHDWLESTISKHSMTELEILHGVLNHPQDASRAFFYFRDPLYAANRGENYQAEDAESRTRLNALKKRIRLTCAAHSLTLRENYADPPALAALILADLMTAIDRDFPDQFVPDVWAREDRDHIAYARCRQTAFYVSRSSSFKRLDEFAESGESGGGLTVLGGAGCGKSALLANWSEQWRRTHPRDFLFLHFIGSSAMSSGHLFLLRRLMVAIIRWCTPTIRGIPVLAPGEERLPTSSDALVKLLPDMLDRLASRAKQRKVRAIIVLDALDQLDDGERARLLGWLPLLVPGEVRLIVSTLPGDTLDALLARQWPPVLTVEPLTLKERYALIARYLDHFCQGLSEVRTEKIVLVDASSNPLYLKTLLDDLRATGENRRLDVQIADYTEAADLPALFEKILARFERDYERDHKGLVGKVLALVWAARRGLTEPELLELLRTERQTRLPAAVWSPVRCALEDGLVERDGVLTFAHEHLRKAVQRKFVPDAQTAAQVRARLAEHFEKQPVAERSCDELPWLLKMTHELDRLHACLLDIDRFSLIHERDEAELRGYWIEQLHGQCSMGPAYVARFEQWSWEQGRSEEDIGQVANTLALFLLDSALYSDAEPLFRRALAIEERRWGDCHPRVGRILNNLSELLRAINRLKEAEPLIKRSVAILEKTLGAIHPFVATGLNNWALLLHEAHRFEEAEPPMRRALSIRECCLGSDHSDIACSRSNLARLLMDLSRFDEAENLFLQGLSVEKSLGAQHPFVAVLLHNLAELYLTTGRPAEAEPLLRRSIAIHERSFGANHPHVASGLCNLALALQRGNRCAEAEPLLRRALHIYETSLGHDHPKYATAQTTLALVLMDTGRAAEAESYLKHALEVAERSLGCDHPSVAKILNSLAQLLHATNRITNVEQYVRRALEINERCFGADHPNVALDLSILVSFYSETKRCSKAEPLARRALSIDERSLGADHPTVALRLNDLSALLMKMKRDDEAEPFLRRALGINERIFGKSHATVVTGLHHLGRLLLDANRAAEAEPHLRRALTLRRALLPKGHADVAVSQQLLAAALLEEDRLAEAEPLLLLSLDTFVKLRRQTGLAHPEAEAAVSRYAKLLQAKGLAHEQLMTRIRAVVAKFTTS